MDSVCSENTIKDFGINMNIFDNDEVEDIKRAKSNLLSYFEPRFKELPDALQALLKSGILTGGISASVFWHEIPNDYDIYLTKDVDIAVFKAMIKQDEVMNLIKDLDPKYNLAVEVDGKLVTANAVTFKNNVQVITCQVADARKQFDFLHCMPYLTLADWKYHISKDQYTSIKNKVLKINPTASKVDEHRKAKFIERGWIV